MASFKDSLVGYVQESFQELKKVTWPTRHKAIRLTFIVLGFCVVMSAALGVLDLAFNYGYHSLVDYAAKVAPPTAVTDKVSEPPEAVTQESKITTEKTTSAEKAAASSTSQSKTSEVKSSGSTSQSTSTAQTSPSSSQSQEKK